jgi:hypothetical protein
LNVELRHVHHPNYRRLLHFWAEGPALRGSFPPASADVLVGHLGLVQHWELVQRQIEEQAAVLDKPNNNI